MQTAIIITFLCVTHIAASALEANSPVQVPPQNVGPVVGNAPVVGSSSPSSPSGVEGQQPQAGVQHAGSESHHQPSGFVEPHHPQHYGSGVEPHHVGPSYYASNGMMTIVGEQPGQVKPGVMRSFEQYGQPEPASIPANYKPFGSWGLYIGGNPSDGYYTDYYKQLSKSVDKQQAGEPVKPVGGQTAAFSPYLKQAGSSPLVGGDYYPFAYSQSELNSGVRPVPGSAESSQVGGVHSPQSLHNVYASGSPSVGESSVVGPSSYADQYATKKIGQAYSTKDVQQQVKSAYPVRVPYQTYQPYASPSVYGPAVQQQQPHVVAYPVPVGSQIVGSQPGVEGSYGPYGVHAFTRYAVKPTVVNSEPSPYYYSSQAQYPTYKQQQQVHSGPSSYYPSFYGFPMSQINGVQQGVVGQEVGGVQHQSVGHSGGAVHHPAPVEEKVEENKPVVQK